MKKRLALIIVITILTTSTAHATAGGGVIDGLFKILGEIVRGAGREINKSVKEWERTSLDNKKKDLKLQKEVDDLLSDSRAIDTRHIFNEKLKDMSEEKLEGLKRHLDERLGKTDIKLDKKSEDYRKKMVNHVRGRLKNKKLSELDHKWIREYIDHAPNEDSYDDFVDTWKTFYLNPHSDLYVGDELLPFFVLPTQSPIIEVPILVPSY